MKCPSCQKAVFRQVDDALKVRTNILVIRPGSAEIQCPHCRAPVHLPLQISPEPMPPPTTRLVLAKKS